MHLNQMPNRRRWPALLRCRAPAAARGFAWTRQMRNEAGLFLAALGIATMAVAQGPGQQPQRFPDVLAVEVRASGPNTFDFDVTVSSPYDTPNRYADGFRARNATGIVYGERKLLHDHGTEQPFTREMYGVKVPLGLRSVIVEARDQKFGYGGKTIEVALPGR
jgi:hypothetical protein